MGVIAVTHKTSQSVASDASSLHTSLTFLISGDTETLSYYHSLSSQYAMCDNFFQPAAGASSMNDMYFARAAYVFLDDEVRNKGNGESRSCVGGLFVHTMQWHLRDYLYLINPHIDISILVCPRQHWLLMHRTKEQKNVLWPNNHFSFSRWYHIYPHSHICTHFPISF